MSLESNASTLQSVRTMAQNPDALYAAALGCLHASPEVQAVLSPMGRAIFDMGYSMVSKIAGSAAGELGQAMLSTAVSVVGKEAVDAAVGVVGDVAGAVAGGIPLLGSIIDLCMTAASIEQARYARETAKKEGKAHDFVLGANRPGSGPGGAVTPADLFAPARTDPNLPLDGWFYQPYHPLGACLVAITESYNLWLENTAPVNFLLLYATSPAPANEAAQYGIQPPCNDDNLMHAPGVLEGVAKQTYLTSNPSGGPVGIPLERQRAYRALRMAIGSGSEKDLHGHALFGLYMDMLAWDFAQGHLSAGWILFVLSTVYVPGMPGMIPVSLNYSDLPFPQRNFFTPSAPCEIATFADFTSQIVDLVSAWNANKSKKSALGMHLSLPAGVGAALVLHEQAKKYPLAVLDNPLYSMALRVAVVRGLGYPRPPIVLTGPLHLQLAKAPGKG